MMSKKKKCRKTSNERIPFVRGLRRRHTRRHVRQIGLRPVRPAPLLFQRGGKQCSGHMREILMKKAHLPEHH